ncbi:ATP-binding mismatch repair protein [Vermiconidia calcicola]|uniref:ATP-binding mismatch repair protein n=1 Tax=Vermiconidia calcicola TaxID=1690605 RepID=A0ACC3N1J6_9PEZI|nr:ATP-binding mismatch repair protein [Vermiconidia calcicola]
MATIKAIEGRSVHQIQSGQVIADLYSVVKELVENSLDAGATAIDIRFKNQGLDSIEVQDNGKGIAPEDFETIALKHYTSKLSSYEDLTSLDTFGFRGEALSSLCALSKFHIITARVEDGALGKKLEFETSGKLKGSSASAAQKGTTVAVENLFFNLPVRRKELEKNIKREYTKVVGHLHAYACISVGVRFTVSNQMPKAKKLTVFSTKLNITTKENITNVFGTKTLLALVKLDLHLEMEPSKGPSTQGARNWSTQATDRSREVHVQGYISKPVFGEGRQAPDRQMFYVNSRPCGLPQVTKAVNEVYRSFNVSQLPFVFANFVMDTNAYDVNVSPDKRSIMLHDQTALLESLKTALTELFEQTDQTVPQSQLPNRKLPSYKPLTVPRRPSVEDDTPPGAADSDRDSDSDAEESRCTDTSVKPSNAVANGRPSSLIQDWTERDTESRSQAHAMETTAAPLKQKKADAPQNGTLVQALRKAPAVEDSATDDRDDSVVGHPDQSGRKDAPLSESRDLGQSTSATASTVPPDPMGSPYDDLFSQRPNHLPKAVQDFNALMDGRQQPPTLVADETLCTESVEMPEVRAEPEIPAVAPSSQKATPGPVQSAFDRMRPKRTPLRTAEITIGDQTTTTVIGSSPPYKRRRVHQPQDSQAIAQFGASPLLARGLRSFAAPGSQLDIESSEFPLAHSRSAEASDDESEAENTAPHQSLAKDTEVRNRGGFARAKAIVSSDAPTSDALDSLLPAPADNDEYDEDYIDEHEKKLQEDEKVARLTQDAENAAAQPSDEKLRRASQLLKNGGSRRESTLQLAQYLKTSTQSIREQLAKPWATLSGPNDAYAETHNADNTVVKDEIDDTNAESRLSLTVSKTDFERMAIVGQFNLGFVLAVRPPSKDQDEDELFIIDQHAADEKYNYERLQRTVTLQNQRLVRPKPLDITAIEEEIILNNADALKANGFEIESTSYFNDDESTGRRCRLITLPISGEKTFDLTDLEELLHLLSEAPAGSSEIPRPKKVQRMLAMRACRSSIMVGKTLTMKQMKKVVSHMGEMEKPWNCPHGRPTMRHLAGLGSWTGWEEGEVIDQEGDDSGATASGKHTDWKSWLKQYT